MDWLATFTISIVLLMVLFALGLPVAFSFFCMVIILTFWVKGPVGLSILTGSIFSSTASFGLSPIPLFILLGYIIFLSGWFTILLNAVDAFVGKFRARLLVVTLIAAAIMGAISGAAMAMVAALGTTIFPEMRSRGYDDRLSIGAVLAGGLLDPIIPPSILAVILATLANVSVAKLLLAGVMPGIVMTGIYIAYIIAVTKLRPEWAPVHITPPDVSLKQKLVLVAYTIPLMLLIFVLVVTIALGIATPTESAAVACIMSFLLCLFSRRVNSKLMKESAMGTLKVTSMVLLIMASANAFSQLLALSGAAAGFIGIVQGLQVNRWIVFTIMQLIILLLGCFIDQMSIFMISVPIFAPLVKVLNFDPIWFWEIYLINACIGGMTPPFGMMMFVLKGVQPDLSMRTIYEAAIPFCLVSVFCLVIFTLFPSLSTWLPSIVG